MVTSMGSIKLVLAGAMMTLAGCASVPNLGPKPALASASSLESGSTLAGGQGAWPAHDWWVGFGDPQLSALITEALSNSPNLAAAAARVRAANAIAEQAGAALLPSAKLDASAADNKQSYFQGPPAEFIPHGINSTGQIAGTLSFNLDLWGRNRAALAAATSEAQAAAIDAQQTRLMLSTEIASAYADLSAYYARHDVAEEAARVRAATANLTAQRVRNGLDTRGELRQAESRVPAARGDVGALDEAIALTRNRIAALTGAGPDRGQRIARPAMVKSPSGLPDRIGLDLIGRRPDIAAARMRTEAAASRIKVARADFYPNINLTALAGFQALGLDNLFKSGATIMNVGPAISLPIFRGGELEGAYRGARAQYDEAVARYDDTLVTALREVADATASLRSLDVQIAEQRRAYAAADEAARIARIRYQGGLANQLTALQADDTLLSFRRTLVDLEARRFTLDVALVRALGGGFQDQDHSRAGLR